MEIASRRESLMLQLAGAISLHEVPLPEMRKTNFVSSHDSGEDLLSEASFRIPQRPRSQLSSKPPVTRSKAESGVANSENEVEKINTVQNKEKRKKYKPKVVDDGASSKKQRKSPENLNSPDMKDTNVKAPTTPVAPDVKPDLKPLTVDKNTPSAELSLVNSGMGLQLNSELGAKPEKSVRRQLNFNLGDNVGVVMHGEINAIDSRKNQVETEIVDCLVESIDRLCLKDYLIHLTAQCLRGVKRKRGKKSPKSKQMREENLNLSENALVPYQMNALVPYEEKALVLYQESKFKYRGIVALDEDSITEWNILMGEDKGGFNSAGLNQEREEKWRNERENFRYLAEWFIAKMKLIQGDRCFSQWKGSVVDSVVGAFLTQNVSDQLSSSAFISLCARYPPRPDVNATSTEEPIPDFEVTKPPVINEPSCAADVVNPHIEDETQNTPKGSTRDSLKSKKAKTPKKKGYKIGMDDIDWDALRKEASRRGYTREGENVKTEHAADWDAVRQADTDEVAKAIHGRGQDNVLAKRIQDFLNRVVKDHGSMDLDWLRVTPGDQAKEYLLSIYGLGLKSVECVRLLSLHQVAFPVDTNVGRIAVRLGWVPLQPLPESVQMHLLELYPVMDTIQKYLWPRLCKLDQKTLYELHYQMITFGKVFCTKSKPNCNACPLRSDCKHFASAFASARLMLPEPQQHQENKIVLWNRVGTASDNASYSVLPRASNCEPIIEEPMTPEEEQIVEEIPDIEDLCFDDPDEIPTINLNMESFVRNIEEIVKKNDSELQIEDISKALVLLPPIAAAIPPPKLKQPRHLRTVHRAYELPDGHPILRRLEFEERDPTDPFPYLLLLYVPDQEAADCKPSDCNSCKVERSSKDLSKEDERAHIKCSIMIPCRTAMRGSFPLNGTYFQVNEVFADHCTARNPVMVDRTEINIRQLRECFVYIGSTVSSILKGLSTDEIQHCFWKGYVCVREFDRVARYPKALSSWLHLPPTKKVITKKKKIPLAQ